MPFNILHVGDNVRLDGAYIWNDVSVDDNCTVKMAVLDNGVHVYRNTTIQPGCILASKVYKCVLIELSYYTSTCKTRDACFLYVNTVGTAKRLQN